MDAELFQRDQRDVAEGGPSGNIGKPTIRRKRFPGCSSLSCFQDAARSLSVNGNASCSLVRAGVSRMDGRGTTGPEVDAELGCGVSIQD